MQLAIIGSGYVGLVTGACFAHLGHDVVCVDSDPAKIATLEAGGVPFYEPGLDTLVRTNVREGRLRFGMDARAATEWAEIVFLCVPTPPLPDGSADLKAIEAVADAIAPALGHGAPKLVVEKSTVPVRTGDWLARLFRERAPEADFDVASNPEFLREGSAIHDFLHADRVVLGVDAERASNKLVALYAPLNAPILVTDLRSAELIKHASNAFLAMKISFINAVGRVCELAGADVSKVAKGIGLDARIGEAFLKAGAGYGGACFPKDVAAFSAIASELGYDFGLLAEVARINDQQRDLVVEKIRQLVGGSARGKRIGVLGLAFKPNTDDLRGAPALDVIERLLAEGAEVLAHDPVARPEGPAGLRQVDTPELAGQGADALVLMTEWPLYEALDWPAMKARMRRAALVDARNVFSPAKMARLGFAYASIGRP